jgi:hypothetical protein
MACLLQQPIIVIARNNAMGNVKKCPAQHSTITRNIEIHYRNSLRNFDNTFLRQIKQKIPCMRYCQIPLKMPTEIQGKLGDTQRPVMV